MSVLTSVELCMWNPPDGDSEKPTVEDVRHALAAQRIDSEYATLIADSTAWSRAVNSMRDKGTLVRTYDVKGVPHVKIESELVDSDGDLQRTPVGIYKLVGLTVSQAQWSSSRETLVELQAAYDSARETYESADLTRTIQTVLVKDGLGLYSPRKAGGVYFVPLAPHNADLLDRVERFASACGVRFLRYAVPDTAAQRAEVADAVAERIGSVIADHEEAVAGYTAETRAETFARRREVMSETSIMLIRLNHLLNGHAVELAARLDVLTNRMTELQAATPVTAGGRTIAYA